jgi:hypothetical protein
MIRFMGEPTGEAWERLKSRKTLRVFLPCVQNSQDIDELDARLIDHKVIWVDNRLASAGYSPASEDQRRCRKAFYGAQYFRV